MFSDPSQFWAQVVDHLQARIQGHGLETWIEPLRPTEIVNDVLHLEVPNGFIKDWIDSHYLSDIRAAAVAVSGRAMDVAFRVNPAAAPLERALPAEDVDDPACYLDTDSNLNRLLTFINFVVGTNNQLAAAAARAVADRPGTHYNPLFIYGGVGLGKTHLMHALGNALKQRKPGAKVLYVTSERFTNELIDSLRNGNISDFKNRYRNLDVLMIDDIQFLAGKERTQEEFFHTFNHLHASYKQVVIASDQPPNGINGLEERLISRFNWGMVADVSPPDLETRVAILQKRAERERVFLPPDVANFIATNVQNNIRELEGAFSKIVALSGLAHVPISVALAEEALHDNLKRSERRLSMADITRETCTYYGLSEEQVRGPRRHSEYTRARQVAMFLIRKTTRHSLGEIGAHFSNRDHTTVMHSVDKISSLHSSDPTVQEALLKITEKLSVKI